MAQLLVAFVASVFAVLGAAHGLLTLRDLTRPRTFTPTDESVRFAMQSAKLALNPRANLWRARLGFNLSHSLGLVVFGAGLFAVAVWHFDAFASSRVLQGVTLAVSATYFTLSLKFWFWGPAVGSGVSLSCFLVALAILKVG